jgi:hypothetical protein
LRDDKKKVIHLTACQVKHIREELAGLSDDEELVHLTAFKAHHIHQELISVRKRLLDEKCLDQERLDRLRELITALYVPERSPTG